VKPGAMLLAGMFAGSIGWKRDASYPDIDE
jgi:hypothetical protein